MEGGAGEVGGNGDGYEPSALFISASSCKSEDIWYSGNGPVLCRKNWPGSGGAAMKAAFSLPHSVSFAWSCFAHFLWLSVGLSFLNQSLKSSGIHNHALCPQKEQSCVQNWARLVCSKGCSQQSLCCSWERLTHFGHSLLSMASTVAF